MANINLEEAINYHNIHKYIKNNGPIFLCMQDEWTNQKNYLVLFISKKHPGIISSINRHTGEIYHGLSYYLLSMAKEYIACKTSIFFAV